MCSVRSGRRRHSAGHMNDPALRLRGVTKRFGDHVAVSDLSFEVPAGSIYGMLGPNGAGKTTTLRMINDILAPDEGEIRILGDLRPGREAAGRIGYLPEERGLYPKMRVIAMLRFFGEIRGLTAHESKKRAMAWLERLDIADWANNKVQDLSKGMQQKVQFAAALIHEPCIIARARKVLDGALDEIRREAARDQFVAIAFADETSRAKADSTVLADRSLVAGHRARRGHLEVELAPDSTADALLRSLVEAGLAIRRFEMVEPTLHQIFVDRVGANEAETMESPGGSVA